MKKRGRKPKPPPVPPRVGSIWEKGSVARKVMAVTHEMDNPDVFRVLWKDVGPYGKRAWRECGEKSWEWWTRGALER